MNVEFYREDLTTTCETTEKICENLNADRNPDCVDGDFDDDFNFNCTKRELLLSFF